MSDLGHKETDEILEKLEKKIRREYLRATQDAEQKLTEYFADYKRKDQMWQQWVKDGLKTEKEWREWRVGQMMVGDRWREMRDTLAHDYHNANMLARSMVDGYMPDVYSLNHNYSTFLVETGAKVDTSYTLYDRQTVERLIRDDPQLLPPPGKRMNKILAVRKDLIWQEGQIQSVTLQSILQGESIGQMATRIAETLGEYNHHDSVRYARTATTGAENAGRLDGYKRADSMGIKMKQTWIATLDGRTRHEHRQLDGQTVGIDEPFKVDGYEIKFPGDPTAEGFLIWNCRCTTIAQIDGFERDPKDLGLRYDEKLGNMSYEEWKNAKAPPEKAKEPGAAETVTAKPSYDMDSAKLKAVMSEEDYKGFKELADKSPVGGLYEKYADQTRAYTLSANGGSYASLSDNVTFSYSKANHVGVHKYSTLAHECGHMFDAKLPGDTGTHSEIELINKLCGGQYQRIVFKTLPSNSDEFLTALRDDMKALKPHVKDGTIRKVLRSFIDNDGTAGVQDALDGFYATQDSGLTSWGHGSKYYNRAYNHKITMWGREADLKKAFLQLGFDASNQKKVKAITRQYEAASETWANVASAVVCGGDELDAVKHFMPNTLEAFLKLIGGE